MKSGHIASFKGNSCELANELRWKVKFSVENILSLTDGHFLSQSSVYTRGQGERDSKDSFPLEMASVSVTDLTSARALFTSKNVCFSTGRNFTLQPATCCKDARAHCIAWLGDECRSCLMMPSPSTSGGLYTKLFSHFLPPTAIIKYSVNSAVSRQSGCFLCYLNN